MDSNRLYASRAQGEGFARRPFESFVQIWRRFASRLTASSRARSIARGAR